MGSLPRQELEELIALYALNPEAADIFVEGPFDGDVVRLLLRTSGFPSSFSIKEIDSVNVDASLLAKYRLPAGSNKNRVIALAKYLESSLPSTPRNIAALIDADTDRALNLLLEIRFLMYTDYTSMEAYLANEDTLSQFLQFTCKCDAGSAAEFLGLAGRILPAKFCMRAVVDALKLRHGANDWHEGLSKKADWNSFDRQKYVTAYLKNPDPVVSNETIAKKFESLWAGLDQRLGHSVHGHDFIEALFEFVSLRSRFMLHDKKQSVVEFGARLLVGTSAALESMSAEPLFVHVLNAAKGRGYLS